MFHCYPGQKEKLPWYVRYPIALGIASGLAYLHEGCQRRIIHRDIKSANVLLTENFEPQVTVNTCDRETSSENICTITFSFY